MQNGQEIRQQAKKMGAREDDDDVGYPGFDCRSHRKTTAPANPTQGGSIHSFTAPRKITVHGEWLQDQFVMILPQIHLWKPSYDFYLSCMTGIR